MQAARSGASWYAASFLALLIGTLGVANLAGADATLRLQLKTNLLPVTELYSVRSWVVLRNDASAKAVSQSYLVSAADDPGTGVAVAEFFFTADAVITTIPVEVTVELFGPGDQFLAGRPSSIDIPNQALYTSTFLVIPDCLPVAPCSSATTASSSGRVASSTKS